MSGDPTPQDRARDRRESLMWMILAGLGTTIPLGFSIISRTYPAPGALLRDSIGFIIESAVLIATIPFAVKVNHKLDLPGGPLITSTLNREPLPYGWGEVLLGGVLWSVIFTVGAFAVLSVGVGFLLYFFPSFIPAISAHPIRQVPTVKPSAIWLVSAIVTNAFSAAVQEEIFFRFVLLGVFSWALNRLRGKSDQLPTRGQLWLANIIQAYFFGLAHLQSDFHLARGIVGVGKVVVRPLVQPQTLAGLFFGWLYLRKGLETSMVSHTFFDLLELIGLPYAIK
jgi:membrane protease YdiL (CAAX protease family)